MVWTMPWTDSRKLTHVQVGAENIRLGWPVPLSGGSPILGYHVDMEAPALQDCSSYRSFCAEL